MSHEIRTPLNGVLGMAAALETTPLSDLQRRMLGVINESGQSLMTLLSDILDLSKIEAGHMQLEMTPLDLGASLQAVTSLYEETARAKDLGFSLTVGDGRAGRVPGRSHADPADPPEPDRQRHEVHHHRVGGGAGRGRHDRRGPSRDHRRGDRQRRGHLGRGQGAAVFQVHAGGDLHHAQVRRHGSGPGICRELVTAMGGQIGVDSEEGPRLAFWFTLPLTLAAEIEA
jgi:signal transduction histidine kinase